MKAAAITVLLLILCFTAFSTNRAVSQTEERRMKRLFLEIEDGDTVVYRGTRMRFLGVDTPEIRNPELGFWIDQPYGREAKEFTRRQIRRARRLTYVSDGMDRYDRLLVHLFVDGYPLSLMIVEAGLGYETVTVFGDGGYPEIASMILDASRLYTDLPFENPYLWRKKNRAP
jgi:endonuclease YncB( thermonuclease family)